MPKGRGSCQRDARSCQRDVGHSTNRHWFHRTHKTSITLHSLESIQYSINAYTYVRMYVVLTSRYLHMSTLYCIVLYCIVLYCIVLYCIVLYCIISMKEVIFSAKAGINGEP